MRYELHGIDWQDFGGTLLETDAFSEAYAEYVRENTEFDWQDLYIVDKKDEKKIS